MSNKSSIAIVAGVAALLIVGVGAAYMVDVDQTREAKLPDVDVNVEAGQLPAYKVETGDINVGTKKETVKVPEVDVNMVEKEITVPTVDIEPAPAD